MRNAIWGFLFLLFIGHLIIATGGGCAQIGAPTGGPKDTTAPVLIKAIPLNKSVNFRENKIILQFDEYVDLQNVQTNLLVSPYPKNMPLVSNNLRTLTIKLKDSLIPNTTYRINLGDAVKDVNEGNIYKNLVYTFSTGSVIDSLEINGKVILAETGKIDSTLTVMLYKNASDSDVIKRKPDYVTRMNSEGVFSFKNLPAATFNIYTLKDGDGSKTYNSGTELFGFIEKSINPAETKESVTLFAYAEKKQSATTSTSTVKKAKEKKLRYTTNLSNQQHDILQSIELNINMPIKRFSADKIALTDSSYNVIENISIELDSSKEIIYIRHQWKENEKLNLIIDKNAFTDEAGNGLTKTDTVSFKCKSKEDYGSLLLRFKNLNLSNHPIIHFMEGEKIKLESALSSSEYSNKMFPPGEYEIRILMDENNNGKWDPGNYSKKIQPEKAIAITQKISVKANWDNERDIEWKNDY